MKQRPRPIHKKLESATYAHDNVVTLRVAFPGVNAAPEHSCSIPVPLMYRLYHLGRAYDLAHIVALHPTGMVLVDYIQLQTLGLELELLSSIIDDPALQDHVDALLGIIAITRANPQAKMLVKPE